MSESEKKEEVRADGTPASGEGAKRHLSSAERQKIYMERAAGRRRDALTRQEKKRRRIIILSVCGGIAAVALAVGLWALFSMYLIPESRYSKAMELYKSGSYAAAMDAFDAMDGYRDSDEYVKKCILEQARALAGRDDVLTGTSETMPWFSFDEDDEPGMLKFDSELYHGEGKVEIPDVFNGELVRGIAEGSFWRCDFLTAVSLPPSVRIIAKRAFSTCKRLEAIELPDAVTEIGENAFSDCTALSEVRFGSGLVSISQRAFDGCTALSSVFLPEGTVFLGYRAFGGCTALADITLPASLETVEAQAFSGCDAVSGVTFNGSRARLDSLLSAGGEELLKAKEIICTDGKTK
ncbi:MAG: leucine-rich repeat domain-containing protein [Clostridiales bacterium]|nr:leucine-rich repeat domain-containing protein [Clostridiales bacterium]